LAAAIKDQFNVDPELIKGAGGIFDVKFNESMVYSKHETGRFPEHQEVLDSIAAAKT
jgi:selT/selW/selH-like putative selenoprotein